MATTFEVFEKAERIEQLAAEGYRLLADRFGGDAEARELFRRLSDEELQHASRVRLLAARYRHDSRILGALPVPVALDEMLAEAEEALRAIQAGSFARTAEEALEKAAEMEERFSRAHADLLAREGHPALRAFFRQLAEQDGVHEKLFGIGRAREAPPAREASPAARSRR
ncbi:MAG TPA: ferritin family protein [Anaeromyxobacter sp.]|nr:ferritin family protein [Anaeromyxobacter sp.]